MIDEVDRIVATQQRKAPKGKPISSHPLFPAVVALWFGALFGLGSLAVRFSLLETLVVKSRIDLIVPAAAPPLGMTARMLLALILAALGAVTGALIARRIARPKQEAPQRKRNARPGQDEDFSVRALDPHAQAPEPVAVSLGEPVGEEAEASALAHRRRPLTLAHDEVAYVPHEMAPLPGGQPQILDIAEMNLGEPMRAPAESPLDLASFAEATHAAAAEPTASSLDWTEAAPATKDVLAQAFGGDAASRIARSAPALIEQQRQMFQPVDLAEIDEADLSEHEPDRFLPPRQVFGQAPVAPLAPEARQVFGQTVIGDHMPSELVEALGSIESVFDVPEAQPLFAPRGTAPIAEAPAEPLEALPNLGSLGMTDLAARLADSMRRRRAARTAAEAALQSASTSAEPDAPDETLPEAEPEIQVPPPYVPPFAGIETFDEPIAAPFAKPFAPTLADSAEDAASEPFAASEIEVPPAPIAMPAALRPISFDDYADDSNGDVILDSLLPPRNLAPVELAPAIAADVAEEAEMEVAEAAEAAASLEAEDEENYASLLDLGPAAELRNPFVRIEEPDGAVDTMEPVVIFPGQAARALDGEFAAPRPFSTDAGEAAPFRRFDAPAQAEQGQMVAAPGASPQADPAETERALRAALANLQRISGAA